MYRTQVSPHRHGFLAERQYNSNDRGAWITIERFFTTLLDQPRKEDKPWMRELYILLNQPSANLPPIEIPIAPPIAYNIHERLERAEFEVYALRERDAIDKAFIEGCIAEAKELERQYDVSVSGAPETIFESLENIVTEVSDRHK